VQLLAPLQVLFQRGARRPRQHDDAVLVAFAGADVDGVTRQVHVLHAQAAALHQAQPGPVQELGHQPEDAVGPLDTHQDAADLLRRQHDGQPFAPPRPQGIDPPQVDVQHPAVEEDEGVEGLVLGARRYVPGRGEAGQELLDFRAAHVPRVTLVVEEDEACRPLDIALLRLRRVVPQPQHLPELIEQARRPRLRQFADGLPQHLLIEQPQRQPRRRQGTEGVFAGLDDVPQEGVAVGGAQLARVTLTVEDDEGDDPTRQRFDPRLGLSGGAGGAAELVEQTRRLRGVGGGRRRGGHGRSLLEDMDG
jgi:hypothetical protein